MSKHPQTDDSHSPQHAVIDIPFNDGKASVEQQIEIHGKYIILYPIGLFNTLI